MERKENNIKEVILDGSAYILYFSKSNENFELTLQTKNGKQQWSGNFDFPHLTSINDKWKNFVDFETICEVIEEIIEANSFSLNMKESVLFSFKYIILMRKGKILEMELTLKRKEIDREKSIEKLYEMVEKINHASDAHLSIIETKFIDFKTHFEKELRRELMNEIDLVKEENNRIKLNLEELNRKINNTYEQIDIIHNKLQEDTTNVAVNVVKMKPVEFLKIDLSHFRFNYKTIEKTGSDCWKGIMLNENIPSKGIYSFKFKIDQTKNKNIMVGISLNTEDGRGGYFKKNSYLFYLGGPSFYHKGSIINLNSSYNPNIKNGDIISLIVKMEYNEMSLFNNGNKIGLSIRFDYNENEMTNIYPCLDLCQKEDKITLLN
jgi:hypothetical protein